MSEDDVLATAEGIVEDEMESALRGDLIAHIGTSRGTRTPMAEHHQHPTCPTCGRTTGGSPIGPQPPAIGEHTPELLRAEQRLERRQSEYDQARAAFNAAASKHWAAKATSWARTRTVMADGGASLREVGGTDPA